jgi:hypothetical protein
MINLKVLEEKYVKECPSTSEPHRGSAFVILSFGNLAIHQKVFFPKIHSPNRESVGCIIYKE